ncbi:MAG TPA: DUF411 domain-containing protein [Sphingobium sp.]
MTRKFALAAFAASLSIASAAAVPIVVHRDPGCGCCEQWAAQVRQQFGRRVNIVDDRLRTALQHAQGVPASLSSCHTAIVDGLVFEGHVPIGDMKRLLAQRPRGVRGLAVAGMPIGSPGMEVAGQKLEPYNVIAFGPSGQTIFARHGG